MATPKQAASGAAEASSLRSMSETRKAKFKRLLEQQVPRHLPSPCSHAQPLPALEITRLDCAHVHCRLVFLLVERPDKNHLLKIKPDHQGGWKLNAWKAKAKAKARQNSVQDMSGVSTCPARG